MTGLITVVFQPLEPLVSKISQFGDQNKDMDGLRITSQAFQQRLSMSHNTIKSGQENIQTILKQTHPENPSVLLLLYIWGQQWKMSKEGQKNEGVTMSHQYFQHSAWCRAGCCRQSRDNDLILPTMTQTAICYLNPCAQCGGRVKVAFQIRWKRQASVVADSQDCRTYLLNEHSPELMKQPTFQLFRGHSRCPKPRPTVQRTAVPQTFKSTAKLV